MIIRRRVLFLILLPFFFFSAGCSMFTESGAVLFGDDLLFATSFETSADTAGWYGYGSLAFREDAPPGGGERSAYISGACPHPHSAVDLTVSRSGSLVLRAWGKDLGIGGGVLLEHVDSRKSIGVGVRSPEWTLYQSEDTLRVREGDRLRLTMGAGGIVPSAMLVDLVEIEVVPEHR